MSAASNECITTSGTRDAWFGSGGGMATPFTYPRGVNPARWGGVTSASTVRSGTAKVGASSANVSGIDPKTIAGLYFFRWAHGSNRLVATLTAGQAILRKDLARSRHLVVGGRFTMTVAGRRLSERVVGIYEPPGFDPLLGEVLIDQRSFDAAFPHPQNLYTVLSAPTGRARLASLKQHLAGQSDLELQTTSAFITSRSSGTKSTLNLVYVLLGLAIVVSLFGMVNTLVLTTFERTREIGMLRAIGLTRRHTRRMVRHEAITTSLIGATLGISIGMALAALVIRAFASDGLSYAVPVPTIAIFLVIAVGAGALAAVMPARRAARLNILDALHYE